jgi:hypothetical protein
MAIKTSWTAGQVLAAADLTDTFAAKAPSASPTFTGTADFTGATVLGIGSGFTYIGSATASASSSIVMNGVFSASYQWYRVLLAVTASADVALNMRLRASGTDDSTGSSYLMQRINANTTTVAGAQTVSAEWAGPLLYNSGTNVAAMDIFDPQLASVTTILAQSLYYVGSAQTFSGRHNQTTAYDGIRFYPASGTLTGTGPGNVAVRVYGYKNS